MYLLFLVTDNVKWGNPWDEELRLIPLKCEESS